MFLRKMGLFLSILLLILILMNYWMDRELNPHYPLQYQEVFHPKVNADVIILGASPATHGINPKYLESDHLRVYNFSLNGAGPSFYLKWYKKIFQPRYRKPIYVIYGVQWTMFDEGLLQRKIEQDSQYIPLSVLFKEFIEFKTLKTLILNRIALIRERKRLADRLFKNRISEVYIPSRYYNGFIPYERKGGLEKKKEVRPQNSQTQIRAFEALLDEFKKDNIEVIFVQVPGYFALRDVSHLSESMRLLNKIAEKREILFLDYETKKLTEINTNPTLFSDRIHLNERGSETFSKLLKSDLTFFLKQGEAKGRGPST